MSNLLDPCLVKYSSESRQLDKNSTFGDKAVDGSDPDETYLARGSGEQVLPVTMATLGYHWMRAARGKSDRYKLGLGLSRGTPFKVHWPADGSSHRALYATETFQTN